MSSSVHISLKAFVDKTEDKVGCSYETGWKWKAIKSDFW